MRYTRFFFLLCSFITVLAFFNFSITGRAETITVPETKVDPDMVYFVPTAIGSTGLDDTLRTPDGRFNAKVGDITLNKIDSSIIAKANNTVIYKSNVYMHVPLNYFTLLKWEDVAYQSTITRDWLEYWEYSIDWLNTYTWTQAATGYKKSDGSAYRNTLYPAQAHPWDSSASLLATRYPEMTISQTGGAKASITYNTWNLNRDYSVSPIANYKDLQVAIGIRPRNISLNNAHVDLQFQMYDWQLTQVKPYGDNQYIVLEQYKDYFADNSQKSASLTFNNLNRYPTAGDLEAPLSSAELKQQAQMEMASDSVGVKFDKALNSDGTNKFTAQQGFLVPVSPGNLINNVSAAPLNTARSVKFPMEIKPSIYYFKENVVVKKGIMDVRTKNDYFPLTNGGAAITYCESETTTQERKTGIRVENQAVQQTFEICFTLYSKIELTGNVQDDALLGMPELIRPDMLWDTLFTGDTERALSLAQSYGLTDLINDSNLLQAFISDWIEYILWIVAIIAVIYIFIQIGVPLIKAKGTQLRSQD